MDAQEDDKDVVLQQASSDLIAKFKSSLPKFLWSSRANDALRSSAQRRKVRRMVRYSTTVDLIKLASLLKRSLEPFQEWPQLFDPHLAGLLGSLVDAYLLTLLWTWRTYHSRPRRTALSGVAIPLPRAICMLLYTFCKIRGPKVISQFFNNEPKYLEPMLDALASWGRLSSLNKDQLHQDAHGSEGLVWEENYIMLLWLSHLLLTPFDLASISSPGPIDRSTSISDVCVPASLPLVAFRVLKVSLTHLTSASKEREAAVVLLARLVLRPDMVWLGLLQTMIEWALLSLKDEGKHDLKGSIYTQIGVLSFIAKTVNMADSVTIASFLLQIFNSTRSIQTAKTQLSEKICSSAVARKVLVKIQCSIAKISVHLDLEMPSTPSMTDALLEEVIQNLLIALADKDTPVRYSASKALSVISMVLPSSMAGEVVEALVAILEEKILWITREIKSLNGMPQREKTQKPKVRDFSAVDALQWQGLILTLSHMLFRRVPSSGQLDVVLNALIMALGFEQRSSSGASGGTSVRDAACFGIWAIARRYSTSELMAVNTAAFKRSNTDDVTTSAIQVIADELVVTATLDPEGNIRRGASAALQELIGRHPDTIVEGIKLVQTVDYHAVALRSRALRDISMRTANLDPHYWDVVFNGIFTWRALEATDATSRRTAGETLGLLSSLKELDGTTLVGGRILSELRFLKAREIEKRHGLLVAAGAVVQHGAISAASSFWDILETEAVVDDKDFTSSIRKPALTAEGTCSLISALANSCHPAQTDLPAHEILEFFLHLVDLSLVVGDDSIISHASKAACALFTLLDDEWQAGVVSQWSSSLKNARTKETLGLLAALAAVFPICKLQLNLQSTIIESILRYTKAGTGIEAKVGALKSLSTGIISSKVFTVEIAKAILNSLGDYTTDQRGDVGSLVRAEAILAVHTAWKCGLLTNSNEHRSLMGLICGLAVEKLDKIRHLAWACLYDLWPLIVKAPLPASARNFDVNLTSSVQYFVCTMPLLSVDWVRLPYLKGFVTSAGVGSESVLCASRAAIVAYVRGFSKQQRISLWEDCFALIRLSLEDERLSVPSLELVGFLLENRAWDGIEPAKRGWHRFSLLVERAHYKTRNVHKICAAIDIYRSLCFIESVKAGIFSKLFKLLLHQYPSVRNKAAETLYLSTHYPEIENLDWSHSQASLKPTVDIIRLRFESGS